MINLSEYEYVVITAHEMRKAAEQENGTLENLKELYLDIMNECGSLEPVFINYIELLRKDATLITHYEVFEAGKKAGLEDVDAQTALFTYLGNVTNRSEALKLDVALQNGYELLARITGKKGLVHEFTHEYRKLYGYSAYIPLFMIGYNTTRKRLNLGKDSQ